MDYANDALFKTDSYKGKGQLEYSEEKNLFTIRRDPGNSGGAVVAQAAFGLLGRMIYEGMSTGKELATFPPDQVLEVKYCEFKSKICFYLYLDGKKDPWEVTLEQNTHMNKLLRERFADRLSAIEARDGGKKPAIAPPRAEPKPVQPAPQPAPRPVQPAPRPVQPAPQPAPKPVQSAAPVRQPEPEKVAVLCLRTGPLAGRSLELAPGSALVLGRDPAR